MNDTIQIFTPIEKEKYVRPETASRILKVGTVILAKWETEGKIKCRKTPGGHRRYLLSSILSDLPNHPDIPQTVSVGRKRKICYCRVSSYGQKEDLERQSRYLKDKFPDHELIKDIGSGLNFKRKGFNALLDSALRGDIQEIVVTHKDRLCRFGFDLFESILSRMSDGTILVLNNEETSPEKELVNDLISIITVFSSRLYGLRSSAIKKKIKDQATKRPRTRIPQTSENIEV